MISDVVMPRDTVQQTAVPVGMELFIHHSALGHGSHPVLAALVTWRCRPKLSLPESAQRLAETA